MQEPYSFLCVQYQRPSQQGPVVPGCLGRCTQTPKVTLWYNLYTMVYSNTMVQPVYYGQTRNISGLPSMLPRQRTCPNAPVPSNFPLDHVTGTLPML